MLKTKNKPSKNIQKYMEAAKNSEEISKETEAEYVLLAKDDPKYKEALFNAQMQMVMGIARRYTSHQETVEDLTQEGLKGLEEALVRFKPDFKVRFRTYAQFWANAFIRRYFANNVRGFRVPSAATQKLFKLNSAIEQLSKGLHREPTDEEVAQELSYDPAYVNFLRKFLVPHVSLETPMQSNHGPSTKTIGDNLTDNHIDDASESLIRRDGVEKIKEALGILSKKELFVIENRYGLNGAEEGQTLQDVGKKMNLSAERIRQIQESAENRLRKAMDR